MGIKGIGAVCGWVSLTVGVTLAVLLWFYPRWLHDHISDRMNACVLVMVTVTGWSECISRSVVFFSLSSLHAASPKAGRGDRHEEEGTRQNYPRLFRAKRCDPKRTRFGVSALSRAIASGGTQIGI
jgi:hypothetical protein